MKRVVTVGGTNALPYIEALAAAGLELVEGDTLDGFAGLVLMGGSDVNPRLYGEEPGPHTEEPDDTRDAIELKLITEALDKDIPILGICRGLQILNVQDGGTLHQHVDGHQVRSKDKGQPVHPVEIVPDSRLAEIAGNRLNVNSRHHQAIAQLGRHLVVSAVDPRDGTYEAVERPDRKFVVAVQWHPENQADNAMLFEAFAASL